MGAMSQTVGTVCFMLVPPAALSATANGLLQEWRYVFFAFAILTLLPFILFLIFGTAEVQEWAKMENTEKSPLVHNGS